MEIIGKVELLHPENFMMHFEVSYDKEDTKKVYIHNVTEKDIPVATGNNVSDVFSDFSVYMKRFIQG